MLAQAGAPPAAFGLLVGEPVALPVAAGAVVAAWAEVAGAEVAGADVVAAGALALEPEDPEEQPAASAAAASAAPASRTRRTRGVDVFTGNLSQVRTLPWVRFPPGMPACGVAKEPADAGQFRVAAWTRWYGVGGTADA
jgi:hypothetical protein